VCFWRLKAREPAAGSDRGSTSRSASELQAFQANSIARGLPRRSPGRRRDEGGRVVPAADHGPRSVLPRASPRM